MADVPGRFDPLRRRILAALALTAAGRAIRLPADEPDDAEAAAVRDQVRRAGLGTIRSKVSDRYLVLGDAPEPFLAEALRLCDGLARDFLGHFAQKGFDVEPPSKRLTVVVLSSPEAYAAYLGRPPGEAAGGHYEPGTNRLIIFDNRARANHGAGVARANTIALMHEAAHQLTFNTGLLDRRADVPGWLSEGLAMYCEVRRPDGRTKVGARNEERLLVLRQARAAGSWPKVAELLAADALLDDPQTEQAAYALSWLLVYHLMRSPERLPDFRAYLIALRGRRDPTRRLEHARAAFGNPAQLDTELERAFDRLRVRPR